MSDLLLKASVPATEPAQYWSAMTAATANVPAPVAAVNLGALRHNALDMVVRAHGVPIRIASKSVRVRAVLNEVLQLPGYRGVLAFTLAEALWLEAQHRDIVVAYPTVDRAAIRRLAQHAAACEAITLMVDDIAQLDVIDAVVPPAQRPEIRLAVDVDASWRAAGLGHIGVRRSPVHRPQQAAQLVREIRSRAGFSLVGMMMYEAQIAGWRDATGSADMPVRWVQRRSCEELQERRAATTDQLREMVDLAFVNGGGTGSLEMTARDQSVTELTAGSGLFAGHLFDGYRSFAPLPAAAFALDVVRKPASDIVTVLGGGWIASGPPHADRLPQPVWPAGLTMLAREGAGEVQTPLRGAAARTLRVGDRVWFRHAKSGELAERVNHVHLVDGEHAAAVVPTYRGEGQAFL